MRPPANVCLISCESGHPEAMTRYYLLDPEVEEAKFEKLWGIGRGRLQTPRNEICLRPDWVAMLEARRWIFVPTKERLLNIIASLVRLKKKKVNARWGEVCPLQTAYSYTFVPLRLNGLTIARWSNTRPLMPSGEPSDESVDEYPDQFSDNPSVDRDAPAKLRVYEKPYKNFPVLRARIHPYFVIQYAWSHFYKNLAGDALENTGLMETYSHLMVITTLWEELAAFPYESRAPASGSNAPDIKPVVVGQPKSSTKKRKISGV